MNAAPWWVRPGLDVRDGRLRIAGRDAETLAREMGTPSFVYDLDRFGENVRRLGDAFARAGIPVRQRFALKANREPEVLAALRALGGPGEPGSIGIDACSPGEVVHALAHGWRPDEISFTGTNVSERDLDALLAHPIHLNLDALSQVERVGRRAAELPPGRRIGLRVNPGARERVTEPADVLAEPVEVVDERRRAHLAGQRLRGAARDPEPAVADVETGPDPPRGRVQRVASESSRRAEASAISATAASNAWVLRWDGTR